MSFLIGYLVLAFDEPQTAPPDCNSALNEGCNLPINVGSNYQEKIGPLVINRGGAHTGFIVDDAGFPDEGFVGIGTLNPIHKLDVAGEANADKLCIGGDCRDSWPASNVESFYDQLSVDLGLFCPDIATVTITTTTDRPVLILYSFTATTDSLADQGVLGRLDRDGTPLHNITHRINDSADATLSSYYFDQVGVGGTYTYTLCGLAPADVDAFLRELIAIEL